jgi:hypothetical protein
MAVEVVLAVLFFASFVLQFNDDDQIFNWVVFYGLHSILAVAVGLYITFEKFKPLRLYGISVSGLLVVWGFVLVITTSVDLAKSDKGGDADGGDIDGATDREAKAFELGGAALGLMAGLFQAACLIR